MVFRLVYNKIMTKIILFFLAIVVMLFVLKKVLIPLLIMAVILAGCAYCGYRYWRLIKKDTEVQGAINDIISFSKKVMSWFIEK